MILGPTDVDNAGLSVVSTTSFAADRGEISSMYDFSRIAAGDLRSVHPMSFDSFLVAFGTTWPTGVADTTNTGFSSHTTRLNPSFYAVTPGAAGRCDPITDRAGNPGEMNTRTLDASALRLIGGASSGDRVVYLRDGGTDPALTVYSTSLQTSADLNVRYDSGAMLPASTPSAFPGPVIWNRGTEFLPDGSLVVFGSSTVDNAVYMMLLRLETLAFPAQWMYATAKGWSQDPADLAPLRSFTGSPITTVGAMSLGIDRSGFYLTTCALVGDQAVGQIWKNFRSLFGAFTPNTFSVPLGLVSDGSFLGGGIRMHSLQPNPDNVIFDTPAISSGLTYSWTVGSPTRLVTRWGLFPVPRLGQ